MDLAGAFQGRAGDRGVCLPVRRSVRRSRHADRARPSRRLHAARRHRSPPEPGADIGQRRRHDRCGGRHLDHDQLHRERVGHQLRWSHRTHSGRPWALLFLLALFVAPLAGSIPAYATAPALLYVACLMTRSLTEVAWDDHQIGAGRHHRARHAVHLLDRRRNRVRLHLVRRNKIRDGSLPRRPSGCRNSRCAIRDQIRGHQDDHTYHPDICPSSNDLPP